MAEEAEGVSSSSERRGGWVVERRTSPVWTSICLGKALILRRKGGEEEEEEEVRDLGGWVGGLIELSFRGLVGGLLG